MSKWGTGAPADVPTVKDVAARAGVSTATVSRVLSGATGVREALRLKVLEAARSLGYRPNRAARDLRARSSRTVAIVIPDIENPFFTSVIRGAEKVLQSTGYSLLLANYDESPERESEHLDVLRAEGLAGLLFTASGNPSAIYNDLFASGMAMVAVSRSPGMPIDQVTVDNREGAHAATAHLLQCGHHRIGMITGPEALNTARERRLGYEDALRRAGIAPEEELIMHCDFRQADGYHAMQRLLRMNRPPCAVFTASNLLTLGALQTIHESNLDIPQDIAIVGFDDMAWATSLRPPLTAVAQPAIEVGAAAAELLLARIKAPGSPPRHIVLETQLKVRASCGGHLVRAERIALRL